MQAAFQPQVAGERDSVRRHRRPRIADYNFRASSAQAKARKRKQMKGKLLSFPFTNFLESGLFNEL
jgi:hypothetical protein